MLNLVLLIIAGSLACLDRTQAFQVMLSRPIVASTLIGFWAGTPLEGAAIGAAFEFLYAGRLPVGSNVPPCDSLAAIGAAGILLLIPGFAGLGNAGLAVALALPLAEWGRVLDVWIRRVNGRIGERLELLIARGDLTYIESAPWLSLAFSFLAYAVTLGLFFLGSTIAITLLGKLPVWLNGAFALFISGLPLLGLAESLMSLGVRRFANWAIAGLSLGLVIMLWVL